MKTLLRRAVCLAGLLAAALVAHAQSTAVPASAESHAARGDARTPARVGDAGTTRRVLYWNNATVKAVQFDYVPPAAGENRAYLEQPGPTSGSRAMAIVQLAVFDAINAIGGRYPSYSGIGRAASDTSPDAAVAQAAHDALVALWPSQRRRFDKWLADDLARIPAGRAKWNGIDLGRRAAAAILELRANDNSANTNRTVGVDYFPSNEPGKWRPDPVTGSTVAGGVTWGDVRPFGVPSVEPFKVPPPPPLTSDLYTRAFYEVKRLGGDGKITPTVRTPEQTFIGIFWSYDGSPGIGTPPCMYNEILEHIAKGRTTDALEMARLFALANVAMADAGIAAWRDKYRYDLWRPVTGIREADEGTGPTGRGDGNPNTHGDPSWTPLGAQASNTRNPDFTPPFPSYPSGHSSFGGAVFQILRRFYGTDKISFTFVSDEWNGVTRDNEGWVRPLRPRSYATLSQAELENAVSRLYLGVHWRFNLEGIAQGNRIANYVFNHGLVPPAASNACGCE
ncbi:MAG: vanadium-dependent haloperoxidase [Telluria sp.]